MSTTEHNPKGDAAVTGFANLADKYEHGTGGFTREVARKVMSMSPPFTNNSKVLDNATGTGIVVEEIQKHISATNPNSNSHIQIPVIAADAAQPMIDHLNAKLKHVEANNAWPNLNLVTTHAVPAEQLDERVVPSGSITHAYMNFGIFFCSDPVQAASHMYRSLAPGGTAVITTWHDLGNTSVHQTHKQLYPEEPDIKMPFSEQWEDPIYVRELLVKAGFEESKIRVVQENTYMRHATLREMAATKTDLFTALIKGLDGWKSEEAKEAFTKRLAENLLECDSFSDEGSEGVKLKMVANIAICTK